MSECIIYILLLVLFSGLAALNARDQAEKRLYLKIFYILTGFKVFMLFIWTIMQSGTLDLSYLHFPDEKYYYFNKGGFGSYINAYCYLVWVLKKLGFSIYNLKFFNNLLISFAVIRLLTLQKYLDKPDNYIRIAVILGGLLYFRAAYFSMFVLKDAIFFYLTVELFIQLFLRRFEDNVFKIIAVILLLVLIRRYMVFLVLICIFDKNWTIKFGRIFLLTGLFLILTVIFFDDIKMQFIHLVSHGLSVNSPYYRPVFFKKMIVYYPDTFPLLYRSLIWKNLKNTFFVTVQDNYLIRFTMIFEYIIFFYLLIIRKNITGLIHFWPALLAAGIYIFGGLLSLYSHRFHLFPVTILLFSAIMTECKLKQSPSNLKIRSDVS